MGTIPGGTMGPMGELTIGFLQNSRFSFDLGLGAGQLATQDYYSTVVQYSRLNFRYRLLNDFKSTPYVEAGGGFLFNLGPAPWEEQAWNEWSNNGFANATIGWEFMPIGENRD